MSRYLAIDLKFWLEAQAARKAEVADKINPFLFLGAWAVYEDSGKRKWAVWADERWTERQLNDIEFWIVNFERMPTLNGGFEEARAEFDREREAILFDADTDTLRAKRADGQTYMRVYPDALPKSWQVYSEELP